MKILGTDPPHRQPRPSPDQPGSLRQQIAAIAAYLRLPNYYRRIDPADAWEFARRAVMPHAAPRRAA